MRFLLTFFAAAAWLLGIGAEQYLSTVRYPAQRNDASSLRYYLCRSVRNAVACMAA